MSNEIKKCLSVAQNSAGQIEMTFLMGDGTKQPMTVEKTAISELITQMSAFNMNRAATEQSQVANAKPALHVSYEDGNGRVCLAIEMGGVVQKLLMGVADTVQLSDKLARAAQESVKPVKKN